jgi:branched-chain amino acid aminotransferase
VRLPDPQARGWVDDRLAPLKTASIGIDDPAFHNGLGLFETIAVRDRDPLDLEQHLERFSAGAEVLGIRLPAAAVMRQAVSETVAEHSAARSWLKLVATRGGRFVVFSGDLDPAEIGSPASAILLPWRKNPASPLAGLKTLNYAENALGVEEAQRRGADEGLWLNTKGHLTEGCSSNLFVVEPGKLFTAAVRDGILPGVVRGLTLAAAKALGFSVHEGKLRLKRLESAREAFLTSSLRGIRPLVTYNGRQVGGGAPGAATRALAEEVDRMRGGWRVMTAEPTAGPIET